VLETQTLLASPLWLEDIKSAPLIQSPQSSHRIIRIVIISTLQRELITVSFPTGNLLHGWTTLHWCAA